MNFPVEHMQGVRSSFAQENPTVLSETPAWAVSLHSQLQASPTCCWNPSGCPESELLRWQRNSLDLGPRGGPSSSGCRLAGWALRVDSSWVVCCLASGWHSFRVNMWREIFASFGGVGHR